MDSNVSGKILNYFEFTQENLSYDPKSSIYGNGQNHAQDATQLSTDQDHQKNISRGCAFTLLKKWWAEG